MSCYWTRIFLEKGQVWNYSLQHWRIWRWAKMMKGKHVVLSSPIQYATRLRFISETIQNAPGLVNARFYRSREPESYYFILTTWEDEDFWYKAQDRYNPKNLLRGSTAELLT